MHPSALLFILLMVLCNICGKDYSTPHGLNIHQRKCIAHARASRVPLKRSHEEAIGSVDNESAPRAAPGLNVDDGAAQNSNNVRLFAPRLSFYMAHEQLGYDGR